MAAGGMALAADPSAAVALEGRARLAGLV